MSADAFVAVAASIAPSLVQSVATKANPVAVNNEGESAPQTVAQTPARPPAVSKEELQSAVQQIQKFLADSQRTLEFQIDESSGTPVVTVRDAKGEIIRQIPNAETLHLAKILKDQGSLHRGLIDLTA